MPKVTITYNDGVFDVGLEEDGEEPRVADHLTFEEMLGCVTSVLMPEPRPCALWLETKEQRAAREAHWKTMATREVTDDVDE